MCAFGNIIWQNSWHVFEILYFEVHALRFVVNHFYPILRKSKRPLFVASLFLIQGHSVIILTKAG